MWFLKSKELTINQSGIFQGAVDFHSHLLPGVDDGIQTLDESLVILHSMEKLGVRKLWLTPHIMEDIPNATSFLQQRFQELKSAYTGLVELELAAEYMIDSLFDKRLQNDDLLPLEEGCSCLLVETSYFNAPYNLLSQLKQIQAKGYYPLLAHPERYTYMSKADYDILKEHRVMFQLNFPSLVGHYGKEVQKKAVYLLKSGMYNCIGNDLHTVMRWNNLLLCKIPVKYQTLLSDLLQNKY